MSLTTPLVRLRILPALLPVDGINADIRVSPDGLYLQKKIGLGAWENLVALDALQGPIGPETELRSNGSYVQWRPKGSSDTAWRDLFALSEIGGGSGGGSGGGPVAFSDITGKPTTLGGYGITDGASQSDLSSGLAGKANTSHTHAISAVTGLQSALDGKAATSHTQAISTITGLQSALDGKSPLGHTHSISDVTGLTAALAAKEATANKGQPGGYASLGSDGKVPASQLPDVSAPNPTGHVWRVSTYLAGETGDNRTKLLALAAEVVASGGGEIIVDRPIETSGAWRFENGADIVVRAEGPGKLWLYRGNPQPIAALRFINCKRVLVQGLYVYSTVGDAEDLGFSINVHQCEHVTIRDHIAENLQTGPWFGYSRFCLVDNCKAINPRRDGIHFSLGSVDCACVNSVVIGAIDDCFACTTDATDQATIGLTYRRTQRIKFIGNTALDNRGGGGGVLIADSDEAVVIGNTIRNTGTSGISVGRHIENQPPCRQVIVANNNIIDPGNQTKDLNADPFFLGCGIHLATVQDCLVQGNNIRDVRFNPSQNKAGILFSDAERVTIKGNQIYNVDKGYGIGVYGYARDCRIQDNDICTTTRSGISASEMAPDFQNTSFEVSGNRLRNVGTVSNLSMQINGASAVKLMIANNVDVDLKESSVAWPVAGYASDNFPPIWRAYAPTFYTATATNARSASNVTGRYTFQGGECWFMGSCTLNDAPEGLSVTAPLGLAASGAKVGFVQGHMGSNGLPMVGRHRDSYPGSYVFVWAGDGGGADTYAQPAKGNGHFRFVGRVPIN